MKWVKSTSNVFGQTWSLALEGKTVAFVRTTLGPGLFWTLTTRPDRLYHSLATIDDLMARIESELLVDLSKSL